MNWVQDGGVLILGTGDRVDDTLGRFAPELLDDSYGTPNITHINLAEEFTAVNEPGAGMLAISCVDGAAARRQRNPLQQRFFAFNGSGEGAGAGGCGGL